MKWIRIVNESTRAPADKKTIDSVFAGNGTKEQYLASVEFAKASYEIMNKTLFLDILPSTNEVKFMLDGNLHAEEAGDAICDIDKEHGVVENFQLVLSQHGNTSCNCQMWLKL